MEHLAQQFAEIPGVVAVTLGGSRATGAAEPDSDWDFGLYYRGDLDPADVRALGFEGRVFAPGDWGEIVNGGAWLTIDGTSVDLVYRDLDQVRACVAEAEQGRFRIVREVGYVAGMATYVLVAELAVALVLSGELPRPWYPDALRSSAPPVWENLALGALHYAGVYARRGDAVACLANVGQAVLAAAQARLAAAGVWTIGEKRIVAAAGLDDVQGLIRAVDDLSVMVDSVRESLGPIGAMSPWNAG